LPEGFSVWKEEPLTFVDSEPEPDISITRGVEAEYARSHPTSADLVIEVAVSSPDLDRANAALYAEASIKEYWIVLAIERRIEVYRRPSTGRYQEQFVCGPEDTLQCVAFPNIRIRVADLFG
jgi:Uma2 family endonuclease